MVSATPQPALPQTGANDSIFTIFQLIEGIINRASAHYVSQYPSLYCGQEPRGHGTNQHKEELKAGIPSRLEDILGSGISDDDWLAMQELRKVVIYATADKFDWENKKMFDMLRDNFKEIYDNVLKMINPKKTPARPIYYRPEIQGRGQGLESSGV